MASILSSLIDFFPRFHTTWNIKHWQSRRSYCHCSQMWVSSGLPLQSRGSNDSPESNTSGGGGHTAIQRPWENMSPAGGKGQPAL